MSDELIFSDEPLDIPLATDQLHWHVLIVDDEPAVHDVTRLVLSDFTMDGRPLHFSHCYSADQAREVLALPNDIALILLDVVMETENAGLDLVRHIRTDLGNLNVRIVLRTGQPGQAPEEQVIRDFDINDYKEKTDLTRRKLVTVFYASLRAYRDLMRLERTTQGLQRSIEAIQHICETHTLRGFASAVLEQVNYLLDMRGEGLCASRPSAYAAQASDGHIKVLAATQGFSDLLMDAQITNLPISVQNALQRALQEKNGHVGSHHYAGYCLTKAGSESVIYMEFMEAPSAAAHALLEIFARNVAITYDSLLAMEDAQHAQSETMTLLMSTIEKQHTEPALHLLRMGQIAAMLAAWSGLAERDVACVREAAALHDIGMTHIDKELLTQPHALTSEQWSTVQRHTIDGFNMLNASRSKIHGIGALMARDHHEHWDGTGYPSGRAGAQISLHGRIAAIADVLSTSTLDSPYRLAQSFDYAIGFIDHHNGSRFDPELVRHVMNHLPEIRAIFEM